MSVVGLYAITTTDEIVGVIGPVGFVEWLRYALRDLVCREVAKVA